MADQSLTDLAPLLRNRDEHAIKQFVDSSSRRLLGIARRIGASPEDAEEIALYVIEYTLRNLSRLDFSASKAKDPLFSYMAKSTKIKTFERRRDRQRESDAIARAANLSTTGAAVGIQESDKGRSIWAGGDDSDVPPDADLAKVNALLEQLDPTDRMVVFYRTETNLTSTEIGKELNMSPSAIRKRWQRVVDRFKSQVSPEVPSV